MQNNYFLEEKNDPTKTIGEWIEQEKIDTSTLKVITYPVVGIVPIIPHRLVKIEWFDEQSEYDLNTELGSWTGMGYGGCRFYDAELGVGEVQFEWDSEFYFNRVETFCYQEVMNSPNNNFYKISDDLYILMKDYEILKHHGLFDRFIKEHTDLTDD